MNPGDSIPDTDDVVRYAGGSQVNEYGIDGVAFQLRPRDMTEPDPGLSCNWLDYFTGISKQAQVECVRKVVHLNPGRDAVFGELNVHETLDAISGHAPRARFAYKPKLAEGQFPDDHSHCELLGLPSHGTHEAERVGDKIAKLVRRIYPARA